MSGKIWLRKPWPKEHFLLLRTSIKTTENKVNLIKNKRKSSINGRLDWLLETTEMHTPASACSRRKTHRDWGEARGGWHTSFSRILVISPRVRSKAETLLFAHDPLSWTCSCFRRSLASRWSLQHKMKWEGWSEREWYIHEWDYNISFP